MKSCFLLCFTFWTYLFAEAQQYNIRTWGLEHGLPQSYVTDLIQDKNKHLWIASYGGIARFDGTNFLTFTKENGLSSSYIKELFEDSRGNIWIATHDEGVCLLSGDSIRHFGTEQGLPKGGVFGVTEDKQGRIWITTKDGVFRWDGSRFKQLTEKDGLPVKKYWDIHYAANGELWLSTLAEGVFVYNGKNTRQYNIYNSELTNNIVYTIYEDRKKNIWLGTYGGITRYNGKTMTPYQFAGEKTLNRGWDFCEDNFGRMWVAFDGGGLAYFNNHNFTRLTTKSGLASNYNSCLLADFQGNIWIGSNNGLQRFSNPHFLHFTDFSDNGSAHVRSLAEDKSGNIWVGTFDGGAGHYDGQSFTWYTTQNGLANDIINTIAIAPDNTVWLGTNLGITSFNGKTFDTFTEIDGLVYSIVNDITFDKKGKMWISTSEGVSVYDGNCFTNFSSQTKSEANSVLKSYHDSQNRHWILTSKGVFIFQDNMIVPFNSLKDYKLKRVNSMQEDWMGNYWFTVYDQGLIYYSTLTKKAKFITTKHGLLHNNATSLLLDSKNQLWIGTIKGMSRLNLNDFYQAKQLNFSNFTHQEGFRGIECSPNALLESSGGNVWAGTTKMLTLYRPELEQKNSVLPGIELTDLRLHLQHVNWKDLGYKTTGNPSNIPIQPSLKHDQNNITFDFQGICLSNPEQLKYRYQLNHVDKDWSAPTPESYATYTNLEPGQYTFKVIAGNGTGGWNPSELRYSFTIVPPFWKTDLFLLCCLVLGSFGVYKLLRLREKNFTRMNTALEMKVKHRTQLLEEKNREKEILIKEVHHRVKNNLQIITSMLNLQARQIKDPATTNVMSELRNRIKSIAMLHQQLYQQEDLAYIYMDEYLEAICKNLFRSYGITPEKVGLQLDIPHLQLDIDTAINLGLIINELLSNALKYAFPDDKTGFCSIKANISADNQYVITIHDNGNGMPENLHESAEKGFGLQLVYAIIKKLQGTIKINSEKGTTISLIFPILPKYKQTI